MIDHIDLNEWEKQDHPWERSNEKIEVNYNADFDSDAQTGHHFILPTIRCMLCV